MALELDHIGIVTADGGEVAEVAAFFRDVLGCAIDGDPAGGYAEAKVGGSTVALHGGARSDVGRHGGTLLQVTTEDVDSEIDAIRARGGAIAAEPDDLPWGRSAYVAGPHGVMVEIYHPA